jgi:hypothetical protein
MKHVAEPVVRGEYCEAACKKKGIAENTIKRPVKRKGAYFPFVINGAAPVVGPDIDCRNRNVKISQHGGKAGFRESLLVSAQTIKYLKRNGMN